MGVAPATAAEREQPKALIWVETPDDRALVKRVRGQVSDLDIAVEVVEATSTEHVSADPHVFALVWFTRNDPTVDRIVIRATIPQGEPRRMLSREIGDGAPTPRGELGSATLEAAALVVRDALRELAAGESPPPPPLPHAELPPPAPPAPERARTSYLAPSRIHFRGDLAWETVLDGVGPLPRSGPGFRLGIDYRAWVFSAFVSASLPATEQDRFGSIRLQRDAFGLRAGREWRLSGPLTLDAGIVAGVALYARGTERLDPIVSAAGDHVTVSALVGPELRIGWAPGSGAVELGFTAGVNAVPGAPSIGYQVDGRFEPSFVIWRVQPSFGIGARLLTDRWP